MKKICNNPKKAKNTPLYRNPLYVSTKLSGCLSKSSCVWKHFILTLNFNNPMKQMRARQQKESIIRFLTWSKNCLQTPPLLWACPLCDRNVREQKIELQLLNRNWEPSASEYLSERQDSMITGKKMHFVLINYHKMKQSVQDHFAHILFYSTNGHRRWWDEQRTGLRHGWL